LVILFLLLVAQLREVFEKAGCVHRFAKIGFKDSAFFGVEAILF
jgi:hypothetical protein